jgi:hypothetical protein
MTNINLPPFKDSNTAIHLPDRKRTFPFSKNDLSREEEDLRRIQEKELRSPSLLARREALSIRLRPDQTFLCGDLN